MKKTVQYTALAVALGSLSGHAALTTGLVSYLDFEDLENDPAANGPNATIAGSIGGVGVAGGQVGSAAEFTGTTGGLISLGISSGAGATSLGESFTIAAWYRLDTSPSSAASRFFVFEASNNFNISYGLRNFSSTDGLADSQTFTGNGQNALYADAHTTGSWQHVAQTYSFDGVSTTTIETFIDGVSQGTVAGGVITSSGLNIGNARDSSTTRAFDGFIDEFGAWDRVLTPEEVTMAYDLGVTGQALTVPEPSSALLVALAGLGLVVRRRS